jgi:hypothetical protein
MISHKVSSFGNKSYMGQKIFSTVQVNPGKMSQLSHNRCWQRFSKEARAEKLNGTRRRTAHSKADWSLPDGVLSLSPQFLSSDRGILRAPRPADHPLLGVLSFGPDRSLPGRGNWLTCLSYRAGNGSMALHFYAEYSFLPLHFLTTFNLSPS